MNTLGPLTSELVAVGYETRYMALEPMADFAGIGREMGMARIENVV